MKINNIINSFKNKFQTKLNLNSKLKIGIDINEVLRARWLQMDKYYYSEFQNELLSPDQPYVYDFFKYYKWEDTVENSKVLREPGELPEDINPIDYQVDPITGEAPVDFLLFKKDEEKKLTAKEVYNRFMYEDFVFEIFGTAPIMYKGMDLHVKNFYEKYKNTVEFILISKENEFSIPSTLMFLSRMMSRFTKYKFIKTDDEIWSDVDILITTDPDIIDSNLPKGKKIIKLDRPYNMKCKKTGLIKDLIHINDLFDNEDFKKIIKYE